MSPDQENNRGGVFKGRMKIEVPEIQLWPKLKIFLEGVYSYLKIFEKLIEIKITPKPQERIF